MKRFVSLLLLLALVLTVFPAGVQAASYPDVYDVSFVVDGEVILRNDYLWYIDSITAPEYAGVEKWYSPEADLYLNPGDMAWGEDFGMAAKVVFTPYVEQPEFPDVYDVSFVVGEETILRNENLWYIDSIEAPAYEGVSKWYSAEADLYLNPGDMVWGEDFGMNAKVVFTPFAVEPEIPEVVIADAKIVDLGWSQFLAVSFHEGYNADNCTLSVDGVNIMNCLVPVTDDGSVVRWEINSLNHGVLEIASEAGVQTVQLSGTGAAVEDRYPEIPEYFLMNGPVYVWDYHLTNYDSAGNVRYEASNFTFDLDVDTVSGATAYSPDAVLHHDENALPYFVTGEVRLEFNYETDAEKSYVDGISDVDLVSANEYRETLNDELHYELVRNIENGEHVNAVITVPLGQTNFTSNGRYNLRVTSNGAAQLFPIHVVEETVPTMAVTGDQGYYGNEVHLRISDMTYGITSPIFRVDLKHPDGTTETLHKFDDWFLHGDLLVLYNSITNHFPEVGGYTVTVYANGFQTFSHTFWHNGFENSEAAAVSEEEMMTVDAVSTASVGGDSSSGGGEGDTKVMNANLLIRSHLLVNAKILMAMGLQDADAEAICARWDSMNKLYAFHIGADQVYDYDAYVDAVNAARAAGQYLTFEAYIASEDAVTTPNRPYSVKQVLEDNLLGETTGFVEAVGKWTPGSTAELIEDQMIVTFDGWTDDFMAEVAAGQLTLNGQILQQGKDYTIEGNVVTVEHMQYGKNMLFIRTNSYQTVRINLDRFYPTEPVELSAKDITKGEEIVVKCSAVHENGKCDFLSHITGVQIVAPNGCRDEVMPDGAESVFEKIGYTVDTMLNVLVIGKDTLLQDCFLQEDGTFAVGEYKLILTADYYGDVNVTVNVADAEIEGTHAVPTVAGIEHVQNTTDNYFRVSFLEEDVAEYLKAITSVTLNGKEARKVSGLWNETNAYKFSNDPVYGGADKFIDFSADCFTDQTVEVVIHAKGYEDLTFRTVNGEHELVLAEAPVVADVIEVSDVMGKRYQVSFQAFEGLTAYLEQAEITLNGTPVKKVTNLFGETGAFRLSVVDDSQSTTAYDAIEFTADCFAGTVEVTVKVTGYKDLVFTVVDGQMSVPTVAAPTVKTLKKSGSIFTPAYQISFEEETVLDYLNAITSVTLNGQELKKVSNLMSESKAYKFSNDSAYGGDIKFIDFTVDCFADQTAVVVIHAEGYQDLTFTANNGVLVVE